LGNHVENVVDSILEDGFSGPRCNPFVMKEVNAMHKIVVGRRKPVKTSADFGPVVVACGSGKA
jgi:hypothetical protein